VPKTAGCFWWLAMTHGIQQLAMGFPALESGSSALGFYTKHTTIVEYNFGPPHPNWLPEYSHVRRQKSKCPLQVMEVLTPLAQNSQVRCDATGDAGCGQRKD